MPPSTPGADPRCPSPPGEGAPLHLTFEMLLADTLHEMAAHDEAAPAEPDAVERLRDDALRALRAQEDALGRRGLHAYPTGTVPPAVLPASTARLDVRS